jgi:hypothetical protein
MSFLFGKPKAPQTVYVQAPAPAPVPVSPVAPASPSPAAAQNAQAAETAAAKTAQVERDKASTAAVADAKAGGRSSNVVAGMRIAAEGQYERGLLSQKKRAAARELGE